MSNRCTCQPTGPGAWSAEGWNGDRILRHNCPEHGIKSAETSKPVPLVMPAFTTLKTGRFPHEAYRASCDCMEGQPKEVKNYAGHIVAPPVCSACSKSYHLDIELMSQR